MVGLKNGHVRKKSRPKMVNPRDIAGDAEEEEDFIVFLLMIKSGRENQ